MISKRSMTKIFSATALLCIAASAASAQEAPAPRRMPRTPVTRETLARTTKEAIPASREVQGLAAIIDGEKLRIGEMDLRLFGIVPPQLAASFGPQARAQLDMLAAGQNVTCKIRDRDRDGRLLANCSNYNGTDLALDLLKHGLAVTARGSIAGTELAGAYVSAEQSAQNQKIGLWSVVATASAAANATNTPAPALQPSKQDSPALVSEATTKNDKTILAADKAESADAQTVAPEVSDVFLQPQTRSATPMPDATSGMSFFERYQILISGLLMLGTTLSIIGAVWAQKTRDRREDRRALAAALRGELMAARGVCMGRIKSIADDADDRLTVWPRIRATLYQAYVGRLGMLGAELARQIASIYGQTSDYATLYSQNSGATHEVSKKQALEVLAKRIDEVLPKLNEIERTGNAPLPRLIQPMRPRLPAVVPQPSLTGPISTPYRGPAEIDPAMIGSFAGAHAIAPPPSKFRAALEWMEETIRQILSNQRATTHAQQPIPLDPHVAEYAALIEADMARYQYGESIETLDIAPSQRKTG